MNVVLLGELGAHARGKTLGAVAAATAGDLPAHGLALAFGKDAQQDVDMLRTWVEWAQSPGRALVLMPPFKREVCAVPVSWEARRADGLAGGETDLGRLLAAERQYELRGELAPIERVGGQVVTGAWRRHPASGLVVATALPLWSLKVLDHAHLLRAWLGDLRVEAGTPRVDALKPASDYRPAPTDWTVLLHLCGGSFDGPSCALGALASSSVFAVEPGEAAASLTRLERAGWAAGGNITPAGRDALRAGPYRDHARAIERRRHV
jgi:hypothetical protein